MVVQLAPNCLQTSMLSFEYDFKYLILKVILVIFGLGISCEIPFRWMSMNLAPDQSRLV